MVDIDPKKAHELIDAGWNVTDSGEWTNGATTLPIDTALGVARTVGKSKPKPFWEHFSSGLAGTSAVAILCSIITAVVANPPPEMALSPTTNTWLKWFLPILGASLAGVQVKKSMTAVKDTQ